jgi:hypothetical protein
LHAASSISIHIQIIQAIQKVMVYHGSLHQSQPEITWLAVWIHEIRRIQTSD